EYMAKYFDTYPGVRTYQDRVIQEAKNKGYSKTLFGRRRPIPELKAGNFMMRQFGERVAMNAPIQGTAADIMKIAMINVFFALKKKSLKSRLILQIHDELVIETYQDEEDLVKDILVKEMERAADLSVPLEVDCHTGSDWYEAK
ncbi:MAG: DNA polymerase I, partial [Butyrivibrio sp.]|nr:DNA polymerase I [Butyrivibrio sp.]